MKKNILSIAVAATLGLSAFSATAEDMYRGAWYAAPGVSYMNTDSDLEADDGAGPFLRFGKELSEHWDVQVGLMHHKMDEDTGIAGVGGEYKQTVLSADALYMFSRDKFRPFLLAGLGVARNEIDYSFAGVDMDNERTSWMANVGLGAQYLFSDKWGMHADLRHQWSSAKYNVSNGVNSDSDTGTIGNTLFNMGIIYRFGEPAAPVVAAVEPAPAPYVAPAPAPEPAPAPAPAPVCTPKVDTITISGEELFGFDKDKLSDNGKAKLDQAIDQIRSDSELRVNSIVITGHTDRIGSEAYNQKLSEKRVVQVKAYMVSKGVDESIIQAVGKGESQPVVACDGVKGKKALVECLAPNRRVEVRAEGSKDAGCK